MNCETCKHDFVCKYKEEYIRIRDKSNSDEYKGIFDICCNEYLEVDYQNIDTEPTYRGFKLGDEVKFDYREEEYSGEIEGINDTCLYMKSGVWNWYAMYDKITNMRYINQ